MSTGYTLRHVRLLAAIRDDIKARPHDYERGADYLRTRYSVEHLQKQELAKWKRSKANPTQQLSWRAMASQHAKIHALPADGPKERKRDERAAYRKLAAPPKADRWTAAKRARHAVLGLVDKLRTNYDSTIAQAVLILAVLLWDADLDEAEPVFDMFGQWGMTRDGDWESFSRYVAREILDNESLMERWMRTVSMAWVARPKAPKSVEVKSEPKGIGGAAPAQSTPIPKGRGHRGRPPLPIAIARERRNLIKKYNKSHLSKKEFCHSNPTELKSLAIALAWARAREKRRANKMPSSVK